MENDSCFKKKLMCSQPIRCFRFALYLFYALFVFMYYQALIYLNFWTKKMLGKDSFNTQKYTLSDKVLQ